MQDAAQPAAGPDQSEIAPVLAGPPDTDTDIPPSPRRARQPREAPARDAASRPDRRPRVVKRVSNHEVTDLRAWLGGLELGIIPAVHVNGAAFTTCVLAVDFGTPRKSVRLTTEQGSELVTRLRAVTKTVVARDVKVGVMTDHSAGIWWTTVT